jgi:hypothetical protein
MYVGHNSFVAASHYLAGYCHALRDHGVSPEALDGLNRWVEMRFEIRSSAWHWTRILIHTYGDDEASFRVFPTLYDEFLADRDRLGDSGIEAEAIRRLVARYGRDWGSPDST